MPFHNHLPIDPECPDNPLHSFYDDPMTAECGCSDEIAAKLESSHRRVCKRCTEYGLENIEVRD